jgi:hypothetical protein
LPYLALGVGAALALIITWPPVTPIPGIDSGIFLFVAQQMLHGAVPYRDLWDNKPPGIYLIDTLGLAIGGGSRWGLCLVEWLSLSAAASMGFATLRRAFGAGPALFASFCWMAAFARSLQGGNFPEEFALPVQFGCLMVFGRVATSGVRIVDGVLLGMLGAIALMLKPNAVGLWVAIAIWSLASSWIHRRWLSSIGLAVSAIVGASVMLAPIALFLHRNHALDAMIDQAVRYNLIYSAGTTWTDRLHCATAQFRYAAPSGLSAIVLGAWVAAAYLLAFQRSLLRPAAVDLIALAAIALPIETVLACTTGDIYFHHFIVPLPCWAILIAFGAWLAIGDEAAGAAHRWIFRRLVPGIALVAIAVLAWVTAGLASWKVASDLAWPPRSAMLRYVTANSHADDLVLTWGLTAAVDFVAGRREPSRFFHEFPLSTRGYTNPRKIALFLDDLKRHPPLLIIDSSAQSGRLPPFDQAARARWSANGSQPWAAQLDSQLGSVFAFVQGNYQESYAEPSVHWKVYRRIESIVNDRVRSGEYSAIAR